MDKTLRCRECGDEFIFTESEQQFFQKLVKDGKITEYKEPKRCKKCRQARRDANRRNNF